MSFQYTDRILEYRPSKYLRAIKNVTRNESFFYKLPDGNRILSPAVLIEAGVQAAAWMCMRDCDFTHRPVLLADENTTIHRHVKAGDQIEYEVEYVDRDDEVVALRGHGHINGDPVISSECVRGYLLPMEDFVDPKVMRIRYEGLYKPDFKDHHRLQSFIELPEQGGTLFNDSCQLPMLDAVGDHTYGKTVTAYKNTTQTESYLLDHFPRQPIVPGVILLSTIGEAAQLLARRELASRPDVFLLPTGLETVRFRTFVKPGDELSIKLKVLSGDMEPGQTIKVQAILSNQYKRVLSGKMTFKAHAVASKASPDTEKLLDVV